MDHSLRFPVGTQATLASLVGLLGIVLVTGCSGSVKTEGVGPHEDGGVGKDGGGGAPDGARPGADARGPGVDGSTCNIVQIVQPIVTVKDAVTGACIEGAVVTAPTGVSLGSCTGTGCGGVCEFNVQGIDGSSATNITVSAPGYGSATVSVMDSYCGCSGDCSGTIQAVALTSEPKGCPAVAPTLNSVCSQNQLECQYGSNPNPKCDELWVCANGGWLNMSGGGICPPPGATCPSSYKAANADLTCSKADVSLLCEYPQGTCICSGDGGGLPHVGPPAFYCTPTTMGCPAKVPVVGSPCGNSALSDCDYGQCSGGVGMECSGGFWVLANVPCPA